MRKPIDYQGFTPSRWMSRCVVCGVAALVLAGCAKDLAVEGPQSGTQTDAEATTRAQAEAMAQTRAAAVENAVYHEATDSWIAPQGDPYRLDNFQKAYDKLSRTTKGFEKTKQLQPTHYALKIYPKTEEEQNRIEGDKEVQVAYVPFDHIQLTEAEVARKVRSKTATTFGEMSPYTVTYDYTDATDGGPTGPVTIQLPILYVVWPIEKPLPTDIEYVIDYEVFLPKNDAEMKALGVVSISVSGNVNTYDNATLVHKNVPLANLKVRSQSGSLIFDAHTDASGNFNTTTLVPSGGALSVLTAPFEFKYEDPQGSWVIVASGSTPYSVSKNITFTPSSGTLRGSVTLTSTAHQENEIHRAVNYFYNVQGAFTVPNATNKLTVYAYNSGSNANGHYEVFIDPLIEIYNNGNSQSEVIGTTLHELGHFAHDKVFGSWPSGVNRLMQESFASYSGWYLGQKYYETLGRTFLYGHQQFTGTMRQEWEKTNHSQHSSGVYFGWYSPLFIDLADTYNQRNMGAIYPNDTISGVPVSVIWSVVSTSQSWAQCKTKLQNYVGVYYTAAQYNGWIADFDYWLEH